jgi:hypothetical protein
VKFNLGPQPPGLVYSRRPLSPEELKPLLPALDHLDDSQRTRLLRQLYCLEWHGQTDLKADDLQGRKKDAGPNKVDQAAGWLEKFLAEYAYPSEEVFVAGKVAGFTKDNLYKAKERLGKDKVGASPDGARKRWWWGLGDPKGWKRRPTPDSPATLPFPKSPNIPNTSNSHKSPNSGEPELGDFCEFGDLSDSGDPGDALNPFKVKAVGPPSDEECFLPGNDTIPTTDNENR